MRLIQGSIRTHVKGFLPIVWTEEALSAHGGLELFSRYLAERGWLARLREVFAIRAFDTDYGSWRMSLAVIGLLVVGGSRLAHLRQLGHDPVFLRFTRLRRLPSDRTLSRWLGAAYDAFESGRGRVERYRRIAGWQSIGPLDGCSVIKPRDRTADYTAMIPQGKQGTGAFQWNRGGWFGSQLGATLWLALLGAALLAQAKPVGGQLLLFAAIPNFLGLVLWRRRNRISPYPAIQALIAICGVSALCGMLCLRASIAVEPLGDLPSIWFLVMYPGLMLVFCLQERSARANAA